MGLIGSNDFKELRWHWEGLAKTDPFWAMCSDPSKKNNKWNKEALFKTGEVEIARVMNYIKTLGVSIDFGGDALDFGCGVGRLAQAMSKYFRFIHGVDISSTMIKLANQYNKCSSKCHYYVNDSEKFPFSSNNYFNFIYTNNTLQHIPTKYNKNYLKEFVRTLKSNGVLIFQIPHYYKSKTNMFTRLRRRLRIRTNLKILFGLYDFSKIKGTYSMQMNYIPENIVKNIINSAGGNIIDIVTTNSLTQDFNGNIEYIKDDTKKINVARQYCVTKNK